MISAHTTLFVDNAQIWSEFYIKNNNTVTSWKNTEAGIRVYFAWYFGKGKEDIKHQTIGIRL